MKIKELAEEIIDFCTKYNILINPGKSPQEIFMAKLRVEEHLKHSWFVEQLIHELLTKTRLNRKINRRRLKILLLKLEKIRLDLEYDGKDAKASTLQLVRK